MNIRTIIYCRLSSIGQNRFSSVSMDMQEKMCIKFANENNLNIYAVHKKVESAYKNIPKTLKSITDLKKHNILISNVDRYCRNKENGIKLAEKCIFNQNILVFVRENLIIKTIADLPNLSRYLDYAEMECITISNRVKKAKEFQAQQGIFMGSFVRFGFKLVDRKKVPCHEEQEIIRLIDLIKSRNSKNIIENQLIRICNSDKVIFDIDEENDVINMNATQIADLLNKNNITRRGNIWTNSSVYSVSRHIKKEKTNVLTSLCDNNSILSSIPIDNIKITENKESDLLENKEFNLLENKEPELLENKEPELLEMCNNFDKIYIAKKSASLTVVDSGNKPIRYNKCKRMSSIRRSRRLNKYNLRRRSN